MATLDLLILLGLGVGLARGFWTGGVRQAASLLGLVLAFLLALQLMNQVGYLIIGLTGISEQVAPAVGFLVVFVVVQIAIFAIARMLEHVLRMIGLGIVNRFIGGAIGGLKAALLLSILFLVLSAFNIPEPEARRQSELYGPVAGLLPRAWDLAADQWPRVERLYDRFNALDVDERAE